jgi:exodeoxyribonuclease V alpha subunit
VTLEGEVERVTFHNPANGYTVLRLRAGGERVTVVGRFSAVAVGERLRVHGDMVEHPTYGSQFRAEAYETFVPTTVEGIEAYLGSGVIKGVGPALAHRLVAEFGARTLEVIEQSPARLRKVPGVGAAKAAAIRERVMATREAREVFIFLEGHGVTPAMAQRIYDQYGPGAVALVRENPYRLAEEVRGIGFRIADRIARSVGFDLASPARARAACEYLLSEARDAGHCFLPRSVLAVRLAELLREGTGEEAQGEREPAELDLDAVLDGLRLMGRVVVEPMTGPDGGEDAAVFLSSVHRQEVTAAQGLARLLAAEREGERPAADFAAASGLVLNEEQMRAVASAFAHRLFVLTGGPGTGKTTVLRTLLDALEAHREPYLLAAPTGRAAKRLAETTGRSARTLHRLLEYGGRGDQGRGFGRDRDNPLPPCTVIVDEASMMDLWLFAHLVEALPAGGRLVLVGDKDQLPSVGAGNVLRDLIASGVVPMAALTRIYRQEAGSRIVESAHAILQGRMPRFTPPDGEFTLDETPDPEACAARVTSLALALGSMDSVQVLTPMRRGPAGVEALNLRLQAALNPPAPGRPEVSVRGAPLRVGDKVMQIRNNYAKAVFNGDSGTVVAIDPAEPTVTVRYPEPEADRDVVYTGRELDEITLAYAVSVHKSQGSEYPAVVLAMLTQHYMLLQRNLLYTAVTRAKTRVAIVGQRRAVAMAVRNNRVAERHTRLRERLGQAVAEAGAT